MSEYDYVIVGGGSSGCALAGRLAQQGERSIAVLEAGKRRWPKITAIPAALLATVGTPRYDWMYLSEPDPSRKDRIELWPRGLGPGGSGLINGMIFVRGAPADFDRWESQGAQGWSYADVLPYFRRLETSEIGDDQHRGALGPQSISKLRFVHPSTELFIKAADAAGVPFIPDYNGPHQDGVSYTQAAQRKGRRHNPFDAFLAPAIRSGAVDLIEGAHAQKALFEGHRAVGVQYLSDGVVRTVRARKLVVLSGGAINSPKLLMQSGIGDGVKLQAAGVTPFVDSPEVGANLMEHAGVFLRAAIDIPTLNQASTPLRKAWALAQWLAGRGPATTTTAQAVAFHRTVPGLDSADVQIHFTAFGFTGPLQTDPGQRLISVAPSVNHPRSRGEVRLRGPDPMTAPLILPRLLEDVEDLATLRRGVRLCGRILASEPLAQHVTEIVDAAAFNASDADLDDLLRETAAPLFHPVGTCRMGSDARSVLTPALRVRGVDGLAVADASVMPSHISGNTHAAALMIGEKAADLFRIPA
jgi:choline dehydrogenase